MSRAEAATDPGALRWRRARNGAVFAFQPTVALADLAVLVRAPALELLFGGAWDAANAAQLHARERIAPLVRRQVALQAESLAMLLFDWLGEQVYLGDASGLVLHVERLSVERQGEMWVLRADLAGDMLDRDLHEPLVGVKAVTLHRLRVDRMGDGWEAEFVLDT